MYKYIPEVGFQFKQYLKWVNLHKNVNIWGSQKCLAVSVCQNDLEKLKE